MGSDPTENPPLKLPDKKTIFIQLPDDGCFYLDKVDDKLYYVRIESSEVRMILPLPTNNLNLILGGLVDEFIENYV